MLTDVKSFQIISKHEKKHLYKHVANYLSQYGRWRFVFSTQVVKFGQDGELVHKIACK